MVCVEALACDVPVLSTPVGIAPFALAGVAGTLCAPFDGRPLARAVAPHLEAPDPRVEGAAPGGLPLRRADGRADDRRLPLVCSATT